MSCWGGWQDDWVQGGPAGGRESGVTKKLLHGYREGVGAWAVVRRKGEGGGGGGQTDIDGKLSKIIKGEGCRLLP